MERRKKYKINSEEIITLLLIKVLLIDEYILDDNRYTFKDLWFNGAKEIWLLDRLGNIGWW